MGFIAPQMPGQYLNGMKEAQSQAKPQVVKRSEQITKDELHRSSKKIIQKNNNKTVSTSLMRLANLKSKQNRGDRKITRLNSSHVRISYAVFCLKKKKHLHNS